MTEEQRPEEAAARPERPVGKITHYFGKISVAAIELTDTLRVGDTIHIKGHTTDFTETVTSMQIENNNVEVANAADCIGIKVEQRARPGDEVFKVE